MMARPYAALIESLLSWNRRRASHWGIACNQVALILEIPPGSGPRRSARPSLSYPGTGVSPKSTASLASSRSYPGNHAAFSLETETLLSWKSSQFYPGNRVGLILEAESLLSWHRVGIILAR